MTAIARLVGVSKRFESVGEARAPEPLRDVDLSVDERETVAIVGPSGSGKTTLLQILGGLTPPSAGRAELSGQDLAHLRERELARLRNEKIGFIFQAHHLLAQCSVLENVLVPTLVQQRRAPQAARERATWLLEQVGLAGRRDHRPGQLSGGECQRVAVARALINDPLLVLADEPTGSLDRATAEKLADLLVELNREQGMTLVTVTHSEALAGRMQRVLRLEDGALYPAGPAP